ncbi:MAG TPA: 2-phospho-L-lactate transferase CofD family protein, partial [Methylomirabilota bacterium]|nr:2-phospho-L-lactate transferase CofD family protein [Methylomirabilota bacterium]
PDIDIVLYHLAGLADEDQGFGLRGDTYHTLEALSRFGYDTWFRLGDRDLATCITRTHLLQRGLTLSQATAELARALGVPAAVLPATDDPLRTRIRLDSGLLEFQEWIVHRGAAGPVREVVFEGAERARPGPGVLEAIRSARALLITPSNPLVSVAPILAVPGVREALRETKAKVVAVSPIVGGATIKGPAAQMLRDSGLEPSPLAVASLYADFLDAIVIDDVDAALAPDIEALDAARGRLAVTVTDTIMASLEKKAALARTTLRAAGLNV